MQIHQRYKVHWNLFLTYILNTTSTFGLVFFEDTSGQTLELIPLFVKPRCDEIMKKILCQQRDLDVDLWRINKASRSPQHSVLE